MLEQKPLVELPSACAGKGEYIAVVHYASPNGEVFTKTCKYSYKDPRVKGGAAVLRDISRMVSSRARQRIVAISVVKRCLHPKITIVPKTNRSPHFERLYSAVVQHAQSDFSPNLTPHASHENSTTIQTLPYTKEELQWLPATDMITTRFRLTAKAVRIPLRGAEEIVTIDELLECAPHLTLSPAVSSN